MSSPVALLPDLTGGNEFAAFLDHVADGVSVQDASGRLVYANAAAVETLGFASAEEMLATPDLLSRFTILDEDGTPIPPALLPGRRALAGEDEPEMLVRFRILATGEEHWSSLRATPILDDAGRVRGVVNVWHDVTALKRNETAQRLLAEAGAALTASLDVEATLAAVARMAVPALADWCVVFLADEDRRIRRVELAAADPARETLLRQIQDQLPAGLGRSAAGGAGDSERGDDRHSGGEPRLVGDTYLRRGVPAADRRNRVCDRRSRFRSPRVDACSAHSASGRRHRAGSDRRRSRWRQELASRAALAVDNARLYAEAQAAVAARDQFPLDRRARVANADRGDEGVRRVAGAGAGEGRLLAGADRPSCRTGCRRQPSGSIG